MEGSSVFWGVILKPEKRYEQVVEESFHVSKACLEPSTVEDGKVTTVYLEKDSDEYIICNLKSLTENLDLNFNCGEKICFRVEGSATVHLTGYLMNDDDDYQCEDDSLMMGDSTLMDESDDCVEVEEEEEVPQLVKKRKIANGASPVAEGQQSKKKRVEQSALDKLVAEARKSKEVKQALSAKATLLSSAEKKKKAAAAAQDDEEMDEDDEDESGEEEEESGEEEEEGDSEEGEEDDLEEESESPAKKPSVQTPASSKKDKKKAQTPAKNGAPVPKKPVVATPKGKGDTAAAETPKSKKKGAADEGKANGVKEVKTPKRTIKGGLTVEDLKVGNGQEATPGKFVGMYYEGTLQAGGKTFDSCKQGKPFKFKLGKGEVIKGWDVGVAGMKVGGKRRLTVPSKMAYGSEGAPPDIPPNAVLVFDVECKSVN